MSHTFLRRALPIAAIVAALAALGFGPLVPPLGPVAPTAKPLSEIEPRIAINAANTPGDFESIHAITQRGSYYLTGNITGENGKMGIKLLTDGVTIDLNGFTMAGVPGSTNAIGHNVGSLRNITIRNGAVTGWSYGVVVTGAGTRVIGITAESNTQYGIAVYVGAVVESCTAAGNTAGGISVSSGSLVRGCTAYLSAGGPGISAAGGGSTIVDCSTYLNATGIAASVGCTVTHCTARDNTADGITADDGSTITDCTAHSNSADGIRCIGTGVKITGCTSMFNTGDGIEIEAGSLVSGNSCRTNGNAGGDGAGIHATGADNRIEGNNCSFTDRGIDIDAAGNFIVRNTCSGNTTNWDIVAGNVCIVVVAQTGAAILGNSGGVAPGSTDPNANFSY